MLVIVPTVQIGLQQQVRAVILPLHDPIPVITQLADTCQQVHDYLLGGLRVLGSQGSVQYVWQVFGTDYCVGALADVLAQLLEVLVGCGRLFL